jgi:hypothetical protein
MGWNLMSRRPIALSPDLLRLQNEEYDIDIKGGYLLVRAVPYVNKTCQIQRGTLIVNLNLMADVAIKPSSHIAYWTGDHPCHSDGSKITTIENSSSPPDFGSGIRADFTFSAKADYRDYYHLVTTYVGRIAGEATKLDPEASARTSPALPEESPEAVFKYIDTASSRAGIGALNDRLLGKRIGIVGLGGTGAYVLDLVAKTTVAEIHIFDGDVFSQHNAFRAPGAPELERLQAKLKKVDHFHAIYSNMRNKIIPHDVFIDETNASLLDGLDFVFLCIDRASAKHIIVQKLVANKVPFIETGMGVLLNDGRLSGIVRIATSTQDNREAAARHISYADGGEGANEYATNIQIAELNALNGALAVIRWKKLMAIYCDNRNEHHGGYSIASGEIVSEGME